MAHEEFCGMGLSGVREFMDEGTVLAGKPLGQGNILRTLRRCKDDNKTIPMTYTTKGREVLLKSRMRENLKSGSVRGLIVTPELLLQKGVAMSYTRHSLCTTRKSSLQSHLLEHIKLYFMYNEKICGVVYIYIR